MNRSLPDPRHICAGRALAAIVVSFILGACNSPPPRPVEFAGYERAVTTSSELAQRHFDEGLLLVYGLQRDEAVRAFESALEHDPDLAMAHWGIAYASAPRFADAWVDRDGEETAREASERARDLRGTSSPVESALIEALSARSSSPAAYADAMRGVWRRFPRDPEVGTFFAEALLQLQAEAGTELWSEGKANSTTLELLNALESVLRYAPEHPGAYHLILHVYAAAPDATKAAAWAQRLEALDTNVGRLLYAPAPIFIRLGRHGDALDACRAAVRSDEARYHGREIPLSYALHHAEHRWGEVYSACLLGERATALRAARRLAEGITTEGLAAGAQAAEGYLASPFLVMVRFGLWDRILEEELPSESASLARALAHYARGVAMANRDRLSEATRSLEALEATRKKVPEAHSIASTPASQIVDIARLLLTGEILYRRGEARGAFAALERAVALEDDLGARQPSGWPTPARHVYGALLLESERAREAARVYREDLERHPENGWSLHGLDECLRRLGKMEEADDVYERFRTAWARSDVFLRASSYSRPSLVLEPGPKRSVLSRVGDTPPAPDPNEDTSDRD